MTEPRCRLYLIAPTPLPDGFAAVLDDALQGGDVAALRVDAGVLKDVALKGGARDDGARKDGAWLAALDPVRRVAQGYGVAVMLAGQPDLVTRAQCDGTHLDGEIPSRDLRKMLGGLQLGVACGFSRDLAMQAGEAGADYVSFGPFSGEDGAADAELVAWWVGIMTVPVVAEGGGTLDDAAALIAAGADFLAVSEAIWQHPAGPRDAVRAFNEAIRTHAPADDPTW